MKENQDEYKFLGYEAHISKVFYDKEIQILAEESDKIVEMFKNMYSTNDEKLSFAGICDYAINCGKLAK